MAVDGRSLAGSEPRAVFALNKPPGVVSTASDPQGRPTVTELVPAGVRLYPVGRLDVDVSGLILLTNDGELANRLSHPSFEVPRTYRAPSPTRPSASPRSERYGKGSSSRTAAPRRRAPTNTARHIELTIHEGRKRQIKRMCAAVGHPVRRLERVAFGPLRLGDLEGGAHRRSSGAEVERLRAATGESGARPRRLRARL